MAKNIEGYCSVCGLNKKMSFEHYPPQAANNKAPVYIKDYRHLTPLGNHLFGKSMRSNNGMGGYKLCEVCNNNTGDWYAKDYSDFANYSLPILQSQKDSEYLMYQEKLKPLNFFKQVMIIFQCIDNGAIRDISNKTNFILDRNANELLDKIQVYMYATLSNYHRNFGLMTAASGPSMEISNYAEFNFHPFGFLLTLDSKPPNQNMKNITPFKFYNYDEEITENFKLPILKVEQSFPGIYSKK